MAFVGRTDVKDPGAQQDQWERLARRRERLYAEDDQFQRTRPDDEIAAAARAPGLVYREPMTAVAGSPVPGVQFQAAVARAGRAIPHVSRELIEKYLADLEGLGVLTK